MSGSGGGGSNTNDWRPASTISNGAGGEASGVGGGGPQAGPNPCLFTEVTKFCVTQHNGREYTDGRVGSNCHPAERAIASRRHDRHSHRGIDYIRTAARHYPMSAFRTAI